MGLLNFWLCLSLRLITFSAKPRVNKGPFHRSDSGLFTFPKLHVPTLRFISLLQKFNFVHHLTHEINRG